MRTATIASSSLCLLAILSTLVGVTHHAAGGGMYPASGGDNALYERARSLRALNERTHVESRPAALRGNESGGSPTEIVVRASADIVGR